eukprot:c27744_g1_i3 orf=125-2134(+)
MPLLCFVQQQRMDMALPLSARRLLSSSLRAFSLLQPAAPTSSRCFLSSTLPTPFASLRIASSAPLPLPSPSSPTPPSIPSMDETKSLSSLATDPQQHVNASSNNGFTSSQVEVGRRQLTKRIKLEEINWDHSFVRELPGDSMEGGPVREVLHSCYTKVLPSVKVTNPNLISWSGHVAELLDLDPLEFERPDFPLLFSGAAPLKGSLPYAQCYGGHQFGFWSGQLGDGRAVTLGELLNSKGERWEAQLKGSGKTPYSRFADGLAVLRSSIREFLCSEAMHHLGIPTTRALCLVSTGEGVMRDMFYDGNPKEEPGAVVCRVAQSFLRFGSYQIHAVRGKEDMEIVRILADYAIRYHFSHLQDLPIEQQMHDNTSKAEREDIDGHANVTNNKYSAWFQEVSEQTAVLIAKWQGVGFTHGVMNTDNMSILGLTIDYGPFGFLDAFDPKFTPNTTDLPGRRYCFANQPDIGLWNVMHFGTTLKQAELISENEFQHGINRYGERFLAEYQQQMSRKLGLKVYNPELVNKLLSNMAFDKVDYTNCFRALGNVRALPDASDEDLLRPIKRVLLETSKERKKAWADWMRQYTQQLSVESVPDEERKALMDSVNPKYVLRNYLCQGAIDAAEQGEYGGVRELLKVMERPFDEQPGMEKYARLPPAWAYRPGVCMLSCSS